MTKKILLVFLALLFVIFLSSFLNNESLKLDDVYNELKCELCDFSLRGTGENNIVDDIDKIIKNRIELGNNKTEIVSYLTNTYPKLFKKKQASFLKFYLLGFVFISCSIFISKFVNYFIFNCKL